MPPLPPPPQCSERPARFGVAWTYLPATGLALASLAFCAQLSLAPTDPKIVTAVFAPWWSGEKSFLAAAGQGTVVAIGAAPFLITVHDTNSTLIQRLRAAGALAVINPSNSPFCGIKTSGGNSAE